MTRFVFYDFDAIDAEPLVGLSDPDADWAQICDVQDDLKEMKTDDTVSERIVTGSSLFIGVFEGFECELSL